MVSDQVGGLTFAEDVARGIRHLLDVSAPYGVYNLTSAREPQTWADVAREVFRLTGNDPARVTRVATAECFARATPAVAPRPAWSLLDLGALRGMGIAPGDGAWGLRRHLSRS